MVSTRSPPSSTSSFGRKEVYPLSPRSTDCTASTISCIEPIPSIASTSGNSFSTSSRYLSVMQPVTMMPLSVWLVLSHATSRMLSIDSRFAASIKAQVFITIISASVSSGVIS